MQEMHAMIGRRKGLVATPRPTRPLSTVEGTLSPQSSMSDITDVQSLSKTIDSLTSSAEKELGRAIENYSRMEDSIDRVVADREQVRTVGYMPCVPWADMWRAMRNLRKLSLLCNTLGNETVNWNGTWPSKVQRFRRCTGYVL